MNYLHACHAGNFADVFKHSLLLLLLAALRRKAAPFAYLDTHAGAGWYDLLGDKAQSTGEYLDGAARIFSLNAKQLPAGLASYHAHLHRTNPDGVLRYYPGSPVFGVDNLREQDRAVLVESQPLIYQALKSHFFGDQRVAVHQRDAYEALKALLPLPEKRGLILLDSPFEAQEREFKHLVNALKIADKRWQGTIAAWYPIKHEFAANDFLRQLKSSGLRDICIAELRILPCDNRIQLNGCGLMLLRPPWQFDREALPLVNDLQTLLGRSPNASARVFTLVEE